jgi:hypothetical protein
MPVRSIRIPDDVDEKILEIQQSSPDLKINTVIVDALRKGLDCPEQPELSDRLTALEIRIAAIEARLDAD